MGFQLYDIAGCDCGGRFVIVICNANSIMDDNFDVSLDGTSIGTIDNGSNTCTGRAWVTDPATDLTAIDFSGIDCAGGAEDGACCGDLARTTISAGLFASGEHTLLITDIAENGAGNWGRVIVAQVADGGDITYLVNSTYAVTTCTFSPGTLTGLGSSQSYNFTI